ncbi:MAG: alpha/beta hydrolase [Actinomycetota bacterium]
MTDITFISADNLRVSDGEIERLWTDATVPHRVVGAHGLRWHAATAGDATNPDVVVFLHGFPETWFAWHHQMAALADRFYCVAIDLKGYGQSDTRLDTDYNYAAQARELPAVLDALGVDRCFLVTHDRGTVIGDHLCRVDGMPSRLRRYVRMQQSGNRPHSEPRPPHELFRSELGAQLIGDGTVVEIAYGREPNPEGHTLVAVPIDDRDIDYILAEVTAPGVGASMSASFVSAGFDRELDDRMNGLFAAMTMPVLFLQGALDPGQQPSEYETVTTEVANGHLQFVNGGHFFHLEVPDDASAAIRAFLTRDDLPS